MHSMLYYFKDCFDNDLGNNLYNNTWNLKHNDAEKQEILNRIMQRIININYLSPSQVLVFYNHTISREGAYCLQYKHI